MDADGFHSRAAFGPEPRGLEPPCDLAVLMRGLFKTEAIGELAPAVKRARESVRAARDLRRREERFRRVDQLAADGFLFVDERGRIMFYDWAAEDMFEFQPQQMLGRSIGHLIAGPGDPKISPSSLERLNHGPRLEKARCSDVGHDEGGGAGSAGSLLCLVASQGEQLLAVSLQDISESRKAQARTERQARLAAVGQLAVGIAHDFNNTSGAITLYTKMRFPMAPEADFTPATRGSGSLGDAGPDVHGHALTGCPARSHNRRGEWLVRIVHTMGVAPGLGLAAASVCTY